MAKYYDGCEHITVKLLNFAGNDLARQCVLFGNLGEFYEGVKEYSPDDKHCQQIVDEIIHGKTFPKFAFEGHNIDFQINDISRVCLAQLTREPGFFCSASSGVRPLTQEFVVPRAIYKNEKWMKEINDIQNKIEKLYIEMLENDVNYMDARYFGFHAQTISICYNATCTQWLRSCNKRTENNIADEINYVYRLMYYELKKAVEETVSDPLSKKLWNWLLSFADKKSWFQNHTFNNDFERFKTPETHVWTEPAHNDWRKSSWKLELERMYKLQPELLLPGEKEMIEKWMKLESENKELPTTFDKNSKFASNQSIKTVYYYNKEN